MTPQTPTRPFAALATYRMGQPARIVAEFDDRAVAAAYVERAKDRYDEVILVDRGADDLGIVWDSVASHAAAPPALRHRPQTDWSGTAVFATREHRDAAMRVLRDDFGARYLTDYRDAQGYGLSWAIRAGGPAIRREARDRLPSAQRVRAQDAARSRFQASLYRNPAYDLVNDPR